MDIRRRRKSLAAPFDEIMKRKKRSSGTRPDKGSKVGESNRFFSMTRRKARDRESVTVR